MNIGAISGNPYQTQMTSSTVQRQSEFEQLGKDLQSGNIAAAQQDFVSLTQSFSAHKQASGTDATQPTLAQEVEKLGQDLQSGNTSAAQADYTQIQRSMQQAHMHGHHHSSKTSDSAGSSTSNPADLLSLLTNTATAAATAYGSAGLTGLSVGTSLLSALA